MPADYRSIACILSALAVCAVVTADGPHAIVETAPGLVVQSLYNVPQATQGSWVSLAADDRGVLYASDQYGPLYRIELTTAQGRVNVQPVDLPIGGIHGLAWSQGELYAVVGEREVCQPGLYRLSDSNADGRFDRLKPLASLAGFGEHGPHAVVPSPDGKSLFVLAGNATTLPPLARSAVPRGWNHDSLARLPAVMGSETRGKDHGGWICRVDPDGREWELVCMGLRNAYALGVAADGELFTCDSDTEFEFGTPWYRPNRVLHCVSGADFGWRSGAQKIPEYAPDIAPAIFSIGPGSPTAILFPGTAALPSRYQQAMLVADWSYGRLLAVHLQPVGASYTATSEVIVTGTPLAIAAACVNPIDKAIYFVTGGRKTQSILYRLTHR